MQDDDRNLTDRWMGVFRSVGREPIGDARYARVEAHRRQCKTLGLLGFIFVVGGPTVLSAVAFDSLVVLIGFAWAVLAVFGAGMLHTGVKRYRHLRGISALSEVEIFVGTTPPLKKADGSSDCDRTTARLMTARMVLPETVHRLVAHPETGLLLEVDGALVKAFSGGDVSITARCPLVPAGDPAATVRSLSALEQHEFKLLMRRNIGLRFDARLQRDGKAGLRRTDDGWVLPESNVAWEKNGRPGAIRLSKGGLGSEADGQTRPTLF